MTLLAYRPFIDPLQVAFPHLSDYWMLFSLPLLIGICLVYKGTKVADLSHLIHDAAKMLIQIIVVMTLAAVAVYVVYWAMCTWA